MRLALPGQGAYDRSRAEPHRSVEQEMSDEAFQKLEEVQDAVAEALSAASRNRVSIANSHALDARDLLDKFIAATSGRTP